MPSRPIHQILSDRPGRRHRPDTPVREVAPDERPAKRSAALVTEHGVLTGIFTANATPPSACWLPGWTPIPRRWSAVMTHNPVTLTEDRPFGRHAP